MRLYERAPAHRDLGLLGLRVGLGLMFVYHGAPKILGGPAKWEKVGSALAEFGIDFAPALWGLLAGLAEAGGGALFAAGLLTRLALVPLVITMMVAAGQNILKGNGLGEAAHALEAGMVFAAMIWIGPGRYSLDERFFGGSQPEESHKKH